MEYLAYVLLFVLGISVAGYLDYFDPIKSLSYMRCVNKGLLHFTNAVSRKAKSLMSNKMPTAEEQENLIMTK